MRNKVASAIVFVCCILFALTVLGTALSSCERRPLEEGYKTALIPVSIIWNDAGLDPDNDPNHDVYSASVWLFSKDGSKAFGDKSYKEYKLSNPHGGAIEVPIGSYSALIFNNTITDFGSNVGFRGTDAYDTFEYYALPDTRSRYSRAEGEVLILEPDILAAWHLDDFEVTMEMITRTRAHTQASVRTETAIRSLIGVRPSLLTPKVFVLAHVKRLGAAISASGALLGMGSSVFLSTDFTAPPNSTHIFSLNNRRLDYNNMDGTVEAQFNSFGPLPNNTNTLYGLKISFTLQNPYNGSTTFPTPPAEPFTFDVTGQAMKMEEKLKISLEIGVEAGGDIILPAQGSSGGFGVGVSDWGQAIDVPIN